MSRERDDAGRYTESVSTAAVLGVFDAIDGPVVTSADVADALGCSRETARRRLSDLEDTGHLASRRTAGRVVWWQDGSNSSSERKDDEGTIDPDDEFWELEPSTSGQTDVSEHVDDVLYDET